MHVLCAHNDVRLCPNTARCDTALLYMCDTACAARRSKFVYGRQNGKCGRLKSEQNGKSYPQVGSEQNGKSSRPPENPTPTLSRQPQVQAEIPLDFESYRRVRCTEECDAPAKQGIEARRQPQVHAEIPQIEKKGIFEVFVFILLYLFYCI